MDEVLCFRTDVELFLMVLDRPVIKQPDITMSRLVLNERFEFIRTKCHLAWTKNPCDFYLERYSVGDFGMPKKKVNYDQTDNYTIKQNKRPVDLLFSQR